MRAQLLTPNPMAAQCDPLRHHTAQVPHLPAIRGQGRSLETRGHASALFTLGCTNLAHQVCRMPKGIVFRTCVFVPACSANQRRLV